MSFVDGVAIFGSIIIFGSYIIGIIIWNYTITITWERKAK